MFCNRCNDLGNSPMTVQVVMTSRAAAFEFNLICSAIDCTNRTET